MSIYIFTFQVFKLTKRLVYNFLITKNPLCLIIKIAIPKDDKSISIIKGLYSMSFIFYNRCNLLEDDIKKFENSGLRYARFFEWRYFL